jgi:hydrophobic/amphiphilic exporter-1 (mainly G- bacteria), HAE1 family
MNVSKIFILRPVMTTLVMATFLIFGLLAFFTLPVNDLPAMDFPTITVTGSLAGANADTMAATVATPLEKQFSTIAGLDSMTSVSQLGQSQITLQFNLDRKIEGAAQDVQSAIVAAKPLLPTTMPVPPTFRKVNPADSPIFFLALSSKTLPLYQVDEYAENMLAPRISMVNGVAQVMVFGSQIYAPHVQVDPRKLDSYGIGINDVETAIAKANVNLPTGTLYGPEECWNVMANGQLFRADTFRPIIVTYQNGAPVRLSDIGDVIDSVQTDKVASWYNDTRAVILAVQKQPNTNTIQIVDDIKTMFPNFRAIVPGSVSLDVLFDRSITIRKSVDDAKRTLIITVVLVILVISLFLGNLKSTFIASMALPISLIGTFAAMKAFGFTLNNISLMGLTLSVGFCVDDTIVVLENIVRHMEMGESPMDAALNGTSEIGFTIISMTASLVAVFIPILFMGGIIGRLFFQFAVTISVAILISCLVSLSLTPMLCSRFLRPTEHGKRHGVYAVSEQIFASLQGLYEATLKIALNNRIGVVVLFVLMVLGTALLYSTMPKGFIPTEDTGQINGTTLAQESISFDDMMAHQKRLSAIVEKDPNIRCFMSTVGAGGPNNSANQGSLNLILKPMGERKLTADQVVQEMRKKVGGVVGLKYIMQVPPSIRIGGMSSRALYQCSVSCFDENQLTKSATDLEKAMKGLPELEDASSDMLNKNLRLGVKIDRDKLAELGLTVEQVQDALNSAYSQRQVSVIYTPTNQYWVILEVLPQYYKDPSSLSFLRIHTANGQLVPLSTVATISRTAGPMQVTHIGQFRAVTFSFNLRPDVSLSQAIAKIRATAKQVLPPDVTFEFLGNAKAFEQSIGNLGFLLVVAILVIYIVLGILYESYFHPVTILSGLPSAGLGAFVILMICHRDLDIYGYLGLVLLIGIVKKNAIMLVDFAVDLQRKTNEHPEDAIYKACLVRFRPITMTTMAALLGSLPIALATGQGAESRQPLGLAIVGGLMVSQIVTLYITPVFYLYLERFKSWLEKKKKKDDFVFAKEY